jgi:hypothetical protein
VKAIAPGKSVGFAMSISMEPILADGRKEELNCVFVPTDVRKGILTISCWQDSTIPQNLLGVAYQNLATSCYNSIIMRCRELLSPGITSRS